MLPIEHAYLKEKIAQDQPSGLQVGPERRGNLPGGRPDAKFVAIEVGELGPFAPWLSAQFMGHRDPTGFERRAGVFYIVGMQDEASHAFSVHATLAAQAEHDMGLCAGKRNFKPALSFAHGLVVYLVKAELVNVEIKGFVLVADAYRDGADFREHDPSRLSVDRSYPFVRLLPAGSPTPNWNQHTP